MILAGLIAAVQTASARITKTGPTPSESWSPLLPLTVGGGFEFETDGQRSVYDFPFLLEYNFSEWFKLTLEPKIEYIASKSADVTSVSGLGDLDTSVEYEFLRERRYRPALTAEGLIKWSTATDSDLGDPGRDYALGIIASKDLVFADVDLGLLYTFVGDPEAQDKFEVSVAVEWPLNHRLSVLGESVTTIETGSGGGTDTEGTLGLAWRVSKFLKLEGGGTRKSDGTWQLLFSWEWKIGGED